MCDDAYQQRQVPAFFDQIMVPEHDFVGADPALQAPDLTMWLPETDWVGEIDLFNNDFGLSIGQTFESQQILDNFFAPAAPSAASVQPNRAATERGNEAKRRSAIFEQSPWYASRDYTVLSRSMCYLPWGNTMYSDFCPGAVHEISILMILQALGTDSQPACVQ